MGVFNKLLPTPVVGHEVPNCQREWILHNQVTLGSCQGKSLRTHGDLAKYSALKLSTLWTARNDGKRHNCSVSLLTLFLLL